MATIEQDFHPTWPTDARIGGARFYVDDSGRVYGHSHEAPLGYTHTPHWPDSDATDAHYRGEHLGSFPTPGEACRAIAIRSLNPED